MKTLREMVEAIGGGQPLEVELGDFLDAFYREPSEASVREPPALLAGQIPPGAMIGAVAEYLCRRYGLPMPRWAFESTRYLPRPYFALAALAFLICMRRRSSITIRSATWC